MHMILHIIILIIQISTASHAWLHRTYACNSVGYQNGNQQPTLTLPDNGEKILCSVGKPRKRGLVVKGVVDLPVS